MMAMFTCDHCGAPVGLHAKSCPRCGKIFDAVRCPRCDYQGPPAAFSEGCPRCHYLAPPARPPRTSLFVPTMAVILVLLAVAVGVAWVLRGG